MLGCLKKELSPSAASPSGSFALLWCGSSLQAGMVLAVKRRSPNLFHNNSFTNTLKAPCACTAAGWTLSPPAINNITQFAESSSLCWTSTASVEQALTQALQQTTALPVPVQFPKPSFPCKAIFTSYPSGLNICSKTYLQEKMNGKTQLFCQHAQ